MTGTQHHADEQVRRYHFRLPMGGQLVFVHFYFAKGFYRAVSFWWPLTWSELTWQFVGSSLVIISLWVVTCYSIYRAYLNTTLRFEVNRKSLFSRQRSSLGFPDETLQRVNVAELDSVVSANEKWITFKLASSSTAAEGDSQFDLHVGEVGRGTRFKICQILAAAGFASLAEPTKSRPRQWPRFTISTMMQFTLLIAFLSTAYRIAVIDFGSHPIAAAGVFALIGIMIGLLIVMAGAIWVGITDSKSAHKCVAVGGLFMAGAAPASLLAAVVFNSPWIVRNLGTAFQELGFLAFLEIAGVGLAFVAAAAWLIVQMAKAV